MKNVNFYLFCVLGLVTLPLCFFNSCGLVGSGGNFSGQQNSGVSNAGNGATPQLRNRIQNNPALSGKDCEGHSSCEDTCDDIYEERDSRKTCYNLSINRVADLEDIFYAFINWSTDELADDLEDIDEDHFKKYLEIGLDGFVEKLVPRIKRGNKVYEKIKNILQEYIIEEEKTVVPVLESADPNNEVLKALMLAHCDLDSNDHQCNSNNRDNDNPTVRISAQLCQLKVSSNNKPTVKPSGNECSGRTLNWLCPGTPTSSDVEVCYPSSSTVNIKTGLPDSLTPNISDNDEKYVVFDYDNPSVYYCKTESASCSDSNNTGKTLTHTKIANIEDDEADLFVALVGAGEVFFDHSAKGGKVEAFSLGHALLNQACEGNRDQCIKLFYRYLKDNNSNNIENIWFNNSKVKEKLGETICIPSQTCAYNAWPSCYSTCP